MAGLGTPALIAPARPSTCHPVPVPRRHLLVLAATAVLASGVAWAMHEALVDDAYITLTQVRTLVEHGEWGLIPGHSSNTATSPLNVVLLAVVTLVVGDPEVASVVLYVLAAVLTARALLGIGSRLGLGVWPAVAAVPLLLLNPLVASSMGLETNLAVAATACLAWAALTGSARAFGFVAGLACLVRLDLVVLVVVLGLVVMPVRRLPTAVGWAALVAAPWFAFSWVALGSFVPDTLLIKQQAGWGNFVTGLFTKYLTREPLPTTASLAVALPGVLALATWPVWRKEAPPAMARLVAGIGAGGVAYYLTFLALGVPPFFWYYGVPLASFTIAGALVVCAAWQAPARRPLRIALAGLVAVTAVPALLVWAVPVVRTDPLAVSPVGGNWARPDQYAAIGTALPPLIGRAPVHSPGEVGNLLYHCDCVMVDKFSDRAILLPLIKAKQRDSLWWRINYAWLDTDEIDRIRPRARLRYRPGPDPTEPRWNIDGRFRGEGHLELTTKPARPGNGSNRT